MLLYTLHDCEAHLLCTYFDYIVYLVFYARYAFTVETYQTTINNQISASDLDRWRSCGSHLISLVPAHKDTHSPFLDLRAPHDDRTGTKQYHIMHPDDRACIKPIGKPGGASEGCNSDPTGCLGGLIMLGIINVPSMNGQRARNYPRWMIVALD